MTTWNWTGAILTPLKLKVELRVSFCDPSLSRKKLLIKIASLPIFCLDLKTRKIDKIMNQNHFKRSYRIRNKFKIRIVILKLEGYLRMSWINSLPPISNMYNVSRGIMDNIGHSIVALAFLRLQIQRASQIIPASPAAVVRRCPRALRWSPHITLDKRMIYKCKDKVGLAVKAFRSHPLLRFG